MPLTEGEVSLKLKLIKIHEYNDIIFGSTGIILNLLLIILIFKKSRKYFEMYRYILLYSRIIHLLLSVALIICGQFIEVISQNMYLIVSGPFRYTLSKTVTIVIHLIFSTSIYLSITSVSISFIYRHTIIVDNKIWNAKKLYIVILINIIIIMPINIFGFMAFYVEGSNYESTMIKLDENVWFNKELNKYMAYVVADRESIYYKLMIGYIFIIICAVYIIILFSSYAVKRKLKQVNRMSSMNKVQKLHKNNNQINNVLFIQALIPLIFILLPYTFWFTCIVLKSYFLIIYSPLLWVHIAWVPTVEAIGTILLVKEFRRGLIKFWRKSIYSDSTKAPKQKEINKNKN